ncbi:protein FAF-like, chloroplastic [Lotus japonicus]|uniref:protein FAF-like, chloroplastic n=1 Tax=Lotus japonicus TaxID=34305 RepID=UPI002589DE84|nr:protein FAF-like, chloroplastic [Lotus japonicus]
MSAVMTNKIQQSQGLLSCSLKIEDETVLTQKHGIVTILGCDTEKNKASSLRRTLSADMSSKKWLPQNGSSPKQKIASSEQLSDPKTIADSFSSSSEEDYEENKDLEAEAEAERERLEIWSSIQRNKKEEQDKAVAGSIDTWSSIISMKSNDEISKSLPPYIHPLVKRSKSCSLSVKSLEICTESLGSETGSDGVFSPSSYTSSETRETEEAEQQETKQEAEQEKQEEKVEEPEEEEVEEIPRYNNYAVTATTKKSLPRSFPPPLPPLSNQTGPSLLHMRPYRDNGRLVLEAVTLPSLNNFSVQRQDGRLVLTFANPQEEPMEEDEAEYMEEEENEYDYVEDLKEEFGGFEMEEDDDGDDVDQGEEKQDEDEEFDVDDSDGEETEEVGESENVVKDVVMEKGLKFSSGATSVKRVALMVNKPIGLVNRNPSWSEKFNEEGNFENVNEVEDASPCQIAQSLPPRPRVARLIPSKTAMNSATASAAASLNFNAYEQYWRTTTKSSTNGVTNPLAQEDNKNSALKNYNSNKLIVSNENQQVLVLRGKNGDYLVHNLKSCKDSRRSFLFWEPYCIATS